MVSEQEQYNATSNTVTYLTLGDGDFSYSVDLARYFAFHTRNDPSHQQTHHVIATGLDSKDESISKYKDVSFLLTQLELTAKQSDGMIQTSVHHGVNAIRFSSTSKEDHTFRMAADHVLFHHPHLGTEDAALHTQFLCHFFDTYDSVWMNKRTEKDGTVAGSLLYLTLVQGQYERWDCARSAARFGLHLVHTFPFQGPPPPPLVTKKNRRTTAPAYYQLRRHQTGRSFDTRRPERKSVTYVFGKVTDVGHYPTCILPWREIAPTDTCTKAVSDDASSNSKETTISRAVEFQCPHCEKVFLEERSRKCHVRDKHPDGAPTENSDNSNKRTKLDESLSPNQFVCLHGCTTDAGLPRSFVSAAALADHTSAKHIGIHREKIMPEWSAAMMNQQRETSKSTSNEPNPKSPLHDTGPTCRSFGECNICGMQFQDELHESRHYNDFVPSKPRIQACAFCHKHFRDSRAKLQHENFCSEKKG